MPNLSVADGALIVDGGILQAPTTLLTVTLREASTLIRDEIARIQQRYQAKSPSIWVLYLGTREEALSEHGQHFRTQGHYTEKSTLNPQFGPYWELAEECGFAAEAREASQMHGAPAGVYLLVKLP